MDKSPLLNIKVTFLTIGSWGGGGGSLGGERPRITQREHTFVTASNSQGASQLIVNKYETGGVDYTIIETGKNMK